ncbi:MAG: DNA repair protein RecO [Patescibacteria group bacterium]
MVKTLALILKKQNLGETDRILTILTPALGKKRVVARGVRKPLSKLSGHLDSLMVSQIIITDKPELPQVTSAVLVESFENARENLELLNYCYAVGKLALRLAQDDEPQQSLFQATVDAFARVDVGSGPAGVWLYYLAQLSKMYGVYVTEFRCGSCGEKISEDAHFNLEDRRLYHLEHAPPARARRLGANSVKLLQLLHGKPFTMIQRIRIPEETARELEEILLIELAENYANAPWKQYARLARD